MQKLNIRDLLYLYGRQITLTSVMVVILAAITCGDLMAQRRNRKAKKPRYTKLNLPNYDQRKLHYGFLIGVYSSNFAVRYADAYNNTTKYDGLLNVEAIPKYGFSLGFIGNLKIADFFDVRITPKVDFNEFELRYRFKDGAESDYLTDRDLVENTMVSIPVLLRFLSQRRGNYRMYMIGGLAPSFQASGKGGEDVVLNIKKTNLTAEFGFGAEFYMPFSKFSPELRFSLGLLDMLDDNPERNVTGAIDRLTTHSITLYLQFH
ncbi:hypothetical protein FUAX_35800 [Fulvitalea axinellae]|uniref:Outer membrane protein beta-barrel domain-containing protein n=1 Tax=Fulvitalea axinellae TaxID=1182444 RepID=A0AAU9CSQ9_9BACT|nr:hypothetical protein FUAX_35800 [Fulvitalea axinellae]